MAKMSRKVRQHPDEQGDPDQVEALVRALNSDSLAERRRASSALIKAGKPVAPRLSEVLRNGNGRARWEATIALRAIRDPESAPALVRALDDEMVEVRWEAAEGIIALGHHGLVALLHGLIAGSGSTRVRESAHRILSAMARGKDAPVVQPVLEALEGPAPIAAPPIAAFAALNALRGKR